MVGYAVVCFRFLFLLLKCFKKTVCNRNTWNWKKRRAGFKI